jgi:hypothetical protein
MLDAGHETTFLLLPVYSTPFSYAHSQAERIGVRGRAKPSTTETVYAHLLADDHSDAMAALGAMEMEPDYGPNVVPLMG